MAGVEHKETRVPQAPVLPEEFNQRKTDDAMAALNTKFEQNHALKEKMRQKAMQFSLVGAIENSDINAVQKLIDDGVNVDAEIIFTKTPLTHAIELKHDSIALRLLEHKCDPNLSVDEFPFSKPIHLAARENLPKVIEKLVELKADVNSRDFDNMSALHIASYYGHVASVNALLNCGAFINLGDSCLRSPLHRAIENGCFDVVKTLLEHGADQNTTDIKGWTPLHLAIAYNFKEILYLLLAHKCKLDIPDINGRTPLVIACDYLNRSNIDIVRETQFYYYGRTIDFLQGRYLNLLRGPYENREMIEMVMSLINKGANVDGVGIAPIEAAICADHGNTVCILISAGAWIPNFSDSLLESLPEYFEIRQIAGWIKSRSELQYDLIWMCKRKIRKLLGESCDNLNNAIDVLPLPQLLKTFLK